MATNDVLEIVSCELDNLLKMARELQGTTDKQVVLLYKKDGVVELVIMMQDSGRAYLVDGDWYEREYGPLIKFPDMFAMGKDED